eukprot:12833892-Alexandrium_andersonii.AAC.1
MCVCVRARLSVAPLGWSVAHCRLSGGNGPSATHGQSLLCPWPGYCFPPRSSFFVRWALVGARVAGRTTYDSCLPTQLLGLR